VLGAGPESEHVSRPAPAAKRALVDLLRGAIEATFDFRNTHAVPAAVPEPPAKPDLLGYRLLKLLENGLSGGCEPRRTRFNRRRIFGRNLLA